MFYLELLYAISEFVKKENVNELFLSVAIQLLLTGFNV